VGLRTVVARSIFNVIKPALKGVRDQDLITVNPNGFWAQRNAPDVSLNHAAELFNRTGGQVIVEIGTGTHGGLAGSSILVWTRRTRARRIIAIDLDPARIAEVEAVTTGYDNVETRTMNGLDFLRGFEERVDLLYLDFWTTDPDGALPGEGRALAYLEAYQAARDCLGEQAIILIDDTDHIHPWKHSYIVPAARKDGFIVQYTGRQTLLVKPS